MTRMQRTGWGGAPSDVLRGVSRLANNPVQPVMMYVVFPLTVQDRRRHSVRAEGKPTRAAG